MKQQFEARVSRAFKKMEFWKDLMRFLEENTATRGGKKVVPILRHFLKKRDFHLAENEEKFLL